MLDKSYLWKRLLATRKTDIYKLICQLVCAVDIIVETVELINHIPFLYTYFFFNFWQLVCVGYIIIVTVELMIHISYFFKSDYNVQSYIDSKFDYHGTIGDWFKVFLCFLVVIFFQESRNRNKSCFTSPVHSRADSVGWCFIHSWRRWHILVSCKQSNRQKQTTNWN